MADGAFAAFDPAFYLHHAFIDYLWEKVRERQAMFCKINPDTAYATQKRAFGQNSGDIMSGHSLVTNGDGLKSLWTEKWYLYEDSPECPTCGSQYLYCNTTINKCVAHSRRSDFNVGQFKTSPRANTFGVVDESFEPVTFELPKRVAFPLTPAPNPDGRFHNTAKEDAIEAVHNQGAPLTPSQPQPPRKLLSVWVKNLEPVSSHYRKARTNVVLQTGPRQKLISVFK